MIHVLKDALNPFNWIKIVKNPSKIIKIFNDRINYYPGLYFGYTKSNLIKRFYMNVNIFLAKKNKNFNEFFFDTKINESKIDTHFDLSKSNRIDETHFKSLKQNGVLVLENALVDHENQMINEKFNKFKKDLKDKNFNDYLNKNLEIIEGSNLRSSYTVESQLEYNSDLKKISDQITKRVYGKEISPSQTYGYNKLVNLPDFPVSGDNVWHSDRYIPNLKILYFPNGTMQGSPFRYSLGSHKINKEYLDFFLNKNNLRKTPGCIETSEDKKKFLKDTQKFNVKPNTLIVAFTNGFHGRTPFEYSGERCVLYLMYSKFRLSSLISFWKYNKNHIVNRLNN